MKKTILLFTIALAFMQFSFAQTTWKADPMHSNTRFEVGHFGLSIVDGEFTTFEGTVETKEDSNFAGAIFNFTVDVNSIDTRIEDRDTHLKSDDFFNAEKYPTITLKNAVLTHKKENEYVLEGDLTIRDVTKKVSFDVIQNNGIISDPWGMTRAGFTAKTEIDRRDFNVNFGDKLPSGIDQVAYKINIIVNLEVVKE